MMFTKYSTTLYNCSRQRFLANRVRVPGWRETFGDFGDIIDVKYRHAVICSTGTALKYICMKQYTCGQYSVSMEADLVDTVAGVLDELYNQLTRSAE